MKFTVIIEKDEDGYYAAEAPDLKGCYTQGKTLEEIMGDTREVVELCLEAEKGREFPKKGADRGRIKSHLHQARIFL
jgi:predicted RNase H-like HicB family nuclease